MAVSYVDPATTSTLTEFVEAGQQDELTYGNFSILMYRCSTEFSEQNLIDYYIDELKKICIKVTSFTSTEIARYKYHPDLLAYDVYGSTQLDFIVMFCNGIIMPQEFDLKRNYILLPRASVLKEFLSKVYNSESDWIAINRAKLAEEESS